jgi:hypothetical protein
MTYSNEYRLGRRVYHQHQEESLALPIALYVSGELIFELYDGGQPCRRFSMRGERFVPTKENEPEAATQSSQTGLRTHQD